MRDEPTVGYFNTSDTDREPLFHHETLDVYRVGLEFMRWISSLPGVEKLCDRTNRQLDNAATSLLLNIAEGNGRYSELDHRRFLDVAAASAVKSAAYLDLCEQKELAHVHGSIPREGTFGANFGYAEQFLTVARVVS